MVNIISSCLVILGIKMFREWHDYSGRVWEEKHKKHIVDRGNFRVYLAPLRTWKIYGAIIKIAGL